MNLRFEVNPPADSAALNRLFAAAWPNHQPVDFAARLKHAALFICAFAGDELVGFVKIVGDGGVHGFLLDPTVAPAWRRRGCGRELVRLAAAEAKRRGLEWIHVDYEPTLAPFYAACGFRPSPAGVLKL